MNIDDFVRNQIKKAHDSMFGDLLRSNKSFDVRYISAYLLFSQRIKGQIGDHDGVSVNDIKSIFVSCLNECELEYDNPTKKLVITYANRSGDKISLTFLNVKTMLGTKETTTDKYDYITVPLSASGSASQKTLSYETITSTDW